MKFPKINRFLLDPLVLWFYGYAGVDIISTVAILCSKDDFGRGITSGLALGFVAGFLAFNLIFGRIYRRQLKEMNDLSDTILNQNYKLVKLLEEYEKREGGEGWKG